MPPAPLNRNRKAIVQLHTKLDVEAIDITKHRTTRPESVARLVQLVPPMRLDLVDEVLYRLGRRHGDQKRWPPYWRVCELAAAVKAVHAGDVRLRGEAGEVVELLTYVDKMQTERRVYRLKRYGVFIGDYQTVEQLAEHVDLATLTEEPPGEPEVPGQLF